LELGAGDFRVGPLAKKLAILAAAVLLAPGCVTRYIVLSEVPKSRLEVVVFTNDRQAGSDLLEKLSARGFDNDQNHVGVPTLDEPTVQWGGASTAQIEEIIAYVEGRYDVTLKRDRSFKLDDPNVFITLPETDTTGTAAGPPDPEDLRIVIFTDSEEKGNELLDSLRGRGYTDTANYVTDEPNDDFNVKWGAATSDQIDEISELASDLFDVELDRQHTFEGGDHDLFINLPFGSAGKPRTKADIQITVLCDSAELGKDILSRLSDLGYTNNANEVKPGTYGDYNIKYGDLPSEMLDEIAGYLQKRFQAEFRRSDEFAPTSRQVTISLPLKK
jgi:hypothetical protein